MRVPRLPKPSAAFIVALAALVVALSGTANSLPGSGSVDHDDLGAHVVHRPNIHDNAVNGAKIANNSLSGADIVESTLSGVNAATVHGMSLRRFTYHVADNGPTVTLLTVSGFDITASCTAGQITLQISSPPAPVQPEINGYVVDLNTSAIDNVEASFQDSTINLLAGTDGRDVVGHAEVMDTVSPSGLPSLSINYAVDEFTVFDECYASGSVVVG